MKRVEYFNTKEELERYYENGVPSTVLAIVQPDAETPAVLYTSSNNSPVDSGQTESQGGGIVPTGTYSIIENGEYEISTYSYVDVDVPAPKLQSISITENGRYESSAMSVNGWNNIQVDVPTISGSFLTEVFGADENDYKLYIPFTDEGDYFTYSFDCEWDGENWTGSLSNAGFALVGRMGAATQYDYDSDSGKMLINNSFTAIQMHVANGALYLGDVFAETGESLDDGDGEYTIAADMWPNTKFLNNGFGAGPENLDMTGWSSGTLTFELVVPKNLAINYDTGYDYIGDGESREIIHPCVYLNWHWEGEQEEEETITDVYSQGTSSQTHFTDMGDGTWLEENVSDGFVPTRVIYEIYSDGTSQAYQPSTWDSTNEVIQFVQGNQRGTGTYGQSGWNWLWDPENKTLSHVSQ